MMKKIINAFIILIVICLYATVFMFIYTSFRERKRSEINKGIINKVEEKVKVIKSEGASAPSEVNVNYNGFKFTVLGTLTIKKIGFYLPILKENTKDAYNTSVVKMSGPNLNAKGNVAIGGHNYMQQRFFIKINRLVKNDVVTITDLASNSVNYYVYEYGVAGDMDASYLAQPADKNARIVTLVTCTNDGYHRYYVKAIAK